jgi:hypothetical protein
MIRAAEEALGPIAFRSKAQSVSGHRDESRR